jgi:hypothetical protein
MSLHTCLLVDDIDCQCSGGDQYRLQRWRSQGESHPIVVALPMKGSSPPDMHSGYLANAALRRLFSFDPGFLYYEVSRFGSAYRCFLVTFTQIGCALRPVLMDPRYRPVKIEALRSALGDAFLADLD